jgi:hypothetical protein
MNTKLFGRMVFVENRTVFEHVEMFRLEKFLLSYFDIYVLIKVVTIAEKPFIFIRNSNECNPATEVLCPRKKLNGIFS